MVNIKKNIKLLNPTNNLTDSERKRYFDLYMANKKRLRTWHSLPIERKAIKLFSSNLQIYNSSDMWTDIVNYYNIPSHFLFLYYRV